MSKNIFIFGAGASSSTGIPVMNNFYDMRSSLILNSEDKKHFDKIRDLKTSLSPLYSHFIIDPPLSNIETLYGLIEMGSLINFLGNFNGSEIEEFKISINHFIVRTIEQSTGFVFDRQEVSIINSDYNKLFSRIFSEDNFIDFAKSNCFITFNYDIALDFELEKLARFNFLTFINHPIIVLT